MFTENEYSFGEKYRTLKRISQELDIAIPFSLNLSASQVRDILSWNDVSVLAWIKENVTWFMIRSSSPFEGDDSGWKLSWVYKSVHVAEKKDILDWIRAVIEFNNSSYIASTHKNFWYEDHPYIPIIIQPYIEWDFAWVISRYGSVLYIEIAPRDNHKITAWDSTNHLSYVWKIGENNTIFTGITSKYFILKPIVSTLQKIINSYSDIDWTIEFTFPKEFILLQFKQYLRTDTVFTPPVLLCQNRAELTEDIFPYEDCFTFIRERMKQMWYWNNEFFIQQDDHMTLYTYFGVRRSWHEKLEHLRIGIYTRKVWFEKVREWSDSTLFPSHPEHKALWLVFYEKFKTGVIFNLLDKYDDTVCTRFEYDSHEGMKYIIFYDRGHEHGFDDAEKYFFLQSIRSASLSYLQSVLTTYTQLYHYFSFLRIAWISDGKYFRNKEMFLKKAIQKFLWILWVCRKISIPKDARIVWQFISNSKNSLSGYDTYQIFTHLNESDIQKIFELRNVWIGAAYVCSDFEPVFLPYIDTIDCLIISRSSIGSHAITIAKEYQKDILFQVKNIEKLIPWNCIFFEKTWTFIEIKICNYEN